MQFCTNQLGGTSKKGVIECPLMSMNVHVPGNSDFWEFNDFNTLPLCAWRMARGLRRSGCRPMSAKGREIRRQFAI